jgi:hypothetical protein
LNIPLELASAIAAAKDSKFSNVARAKKAISDTARKDGYIKLWTGRRVPVSPDALFTSWNYLNQGTVGEMIKRSIVKIGQELRAQGYRSRVALDMHDAIILEVFNEEQRAVLELCSSIMEAIIPDELNNRTNPPIRWTARADLKKNSKKWGKYQNTDFTIPDTSIVFLDANSTELNKTGKKVIRKKRVHFEYEVLDWTGHYDFFVSDDGGISLDQESHDLFIAAKQEQMRRKILQYRLAYSPDGTEKMRSLPEFINIASQWIALSDSSDISNSRRELEVWIMEREEALYILSTLQKM